MKRYISSFKLCRKNADCTHWAWNDYNVGTCWLKRKTIIMGNFILL